jgi:hypothetical protein
VRPVRRITEDDVTFVDATGERYPPRVYLPKMVDTLVRTLLLTGLLFLIGICWEAFA